MINKINLRACVIGAGPSGLYISNLLQKNNFLVDIFEKSNRALGNFQYSKSDNKEPLEKIAKGLKINFLKDHNSIDDEKYDFYVCATGGVERKLSFPGSEYLISGYKLIKDYFERFKVKDKTGDIIEEINNINQLQNNKDNIASDKTEGINIVNQLHNNKYNIVNDKIEEGHTKLNNTMKNNTMMNNTMLNNTMLNNTMMNNISKRSIINNKYSIVKDKTEGINIINQLQNNKDNIVKDKTEGNNNINQLVNGNIRNNRICIIGMGNLMMDLIDYIGKSKKNVDLTVLSRSGLKAASFDNFKLKEVLDSNAWDVKTSANFEEGGEKRTARRNKILKENSGIFRTIKNLLNQILFKIEKKKLNLIFNTEIERIIKKGPNNLILDFKENKKKKQKIFDFIIRSVGFEPRKIELNTKKSIFNIGWSREAFGSIDSSYREAVAGHERILEYFKSKKTIL